MKKSTGFTIVELLIVIVVIAVLAAISIVAYNGMQARAKFTKISSDLASMRKVLELYKVENGGYPTFGSGYRYQRFSGNNFIPGVVPTYVNSLPQASNSNSGPATNDTYIYSSDGIGYILQYLYQPQIPDSEWSYVPTSMKDGVKNDRYGYIVN